jgi:hypothetical protein
MAGETFGQALGRVVVLDLADDQGVVADDLLIRQRNEGLRGSRWLVLKCITNEKAVESFAPTVKRVDVVIALQLCDLEGHH